MMIFWSTKQADWRLGSKSPRGSAPIVAASDGAPTRQMRERWAARSARRPNGAFVTPSNAWPGSTTRRARRAAQIRVEHKLAFWRCSTEAARGYANWTGPLLAKALGDIHVQYVWRFLRAQKIDLSGRNRGARATTRLRGQGRRIVGLYMAPPDAIVLAVDESPPFGAHARKAISNCRTAKQASQRLIEHRNRTTFFPSVQTFV